MLTLYQREGCQASHRVREVMSELQIECHLVNEPRLGSERHDLDALKGLPNHEVPVLVDDGASPPEVLQGSEKIIGYLRDRFRTTRFGDPSYGLTRVLQGFGFNDAVNAAREALAREGFGVLTEIDVRATMKKKLDVEVPDYVILGACNPPLAHRALTEAPPVGLLLPCNVVVAAEPDGRVVVSAVDPLRLFSLVGRPELEPIAKEVGDRLRRALAALG